MAFLCVDIGGTNTLFGVGNGDFQVVEKMRSERFLSDIDAALDQAIEDLDYTQEDIEDVAVAAAGPIDREEKIFYPPNISEESGMDEIDLGELLDFTGKLQIVNDCAAAALGEYHYGDHDVENLVYVTISSGIGAGVIINGELVEGTDGNFGEVGHMKIGEQLECGCGGIGHWEAYCSGENMPQMAEKLFNADFKNSREIFDEYNNKNSKAEKTIAKMHEINGHGLGNIADLYNPEKIVLGGALPLNHPELMLDPLEEQVEENSVNIRPEITLCDLREKAVLHGLRAVCNEKYTSDK